MSGRDQYSDIAESVPFETNPPFISDNVQDAIEETLQLAGSSRYTVTLGKQGNVSNAYLDRWNQIGSDNVPFVVPEGGSIRSASIAISTAAEAGGEIVTVYKNGISIFTLTILAGEFTAANSSLNILVATLDEISAQVTTGAMTNPVMAIFIQTGA